MTSSVSDFLQNTVEPPSHSALALQTRGPILQELLEVAFAPEDGNTPYLRKGYYHTRLRGDIAYRLAWPMTLPPLRCAALSSLAIWY
jgi:hypothetical protein